MESINNQTPARSSEEQLKAKYGGKLYRVGITVPVDDESEKEFSYYFKRPTVPSYDRYIKTAAQGITKASKAFMLDAVIDEDAERLTKDMEENPGNPEVPYVEEDPADINGVLDTSGVDLDLADPVDAMNSGKPNKELRLANMKVTLFEYEQVINPDTGKVEDRYGWGLDRRTAR